MTTSRRKISPLAIQRLINAGLLVSTLFCYLEWADQSAFLFEVEYALFFKSGQTAESFAHPLILLPLSGQVLLLLALFKKQPGMKLSFAGMGLLSLIVLMVFLVGILSVNFKIIFSALPFIFISIAAIIYQRKNRKRP